MFSRVGLGFEVPRIYRLLCAIAYLRISLRMYSLEFGLVGSQLLKQCYSRNNVKEISTK